jgi:serine protease AprX
MKHRFAARRLVPAAVTAGVLVALTGAAVSPAAEGSKERRKGAAVETAAPRAIKADRDKDKVFDDLERRLAPLPANAERSVIVTLRAPATPAQTSSLETDVGDFDLTRRLSLIDAFAATVTKEQVAELAADPRVAKVEENSAVRALNDGAQSSFGVAKARADAPSLDGDLAGGVGVYTGDDLVAAVVDTGIDAGHADLDGGKVLAFRDFVNGRSEPYDDNGHGPHVAATIAGDGDVRADRLH